MSATAFLRSLAKAFGDALEPLREALESEEAFSELLALHGWDLPPGSFDIAQVDAYFAVRQDFDDFIDLSRLVPILAAIIVATALGMWLTRTRHQEHEA